MYKRESYMKLFNKIKARFKKTKLITYLRNRLGTRYWFSHAYKHEKVRPKTVLYLAYRNNIMGGNPYAIFAELMRRPEYKDFTHVWVYGAEKSLKDDTFERYKDYPNVICVKARTKEYCEWLATAEYIICNSSVPSWAMKRDEQIYINTWHGVPLKTLGRDAKDRSPMSMLNSQRNFFYCDYMVMPNAYTIEHMLDAYDLRGMTTCKIVDAGYPRTDLVRNTNPEYIRGLLELRLGQSLEGKKIVLYAPTFRTKQGKSVNTARELGKYMRQMLEMLPEGYELVFKVHNMMARFFQKNKAMRSRMIFDDIETNELLSATDVLITDYSSIFFEFLCTKRPIMFFDYDLEEYSDGRGLYFPLEELPGPICETVEELSESFLKLEDGSYDYNDNYRNFLQKFAYNDDGNASKRVVDIIFDQKNGLEKYIYKQKREGERVLIVGNMKGSLENKGEALLTAQGEKPDENTVSILAPYVYNYREEVAEQLNNIRLISFEPVYLFTFTEKLKQKLFKKMPKKGDEFYTRNYQNYFGKLKFDRIIDLNGDESPWKCVLKPKCKNYEPRVIEDDPDKKVARLEAAGKKLTVLFLATFDSVNYPYVNIIRELEKRGHNFILAVWNGNDEVNNRMFLENDIPFIDVGEFNLSELSKVDAVICSPFKPIKFNKLVNEINRRRILTIGFMPLFSSILMRPYTDIVFSVGRSKFQEFEENGLHYNVVSVGNPQYDALVENFSKPRITDQSKIKRVLFIDQGGYPFGTEGKKLLGEIILAMAIKHPDKTFTVKPRFLPDDIAEAKLLHQPSEHLYDFVPNPPENLVLLREATILEDILPDFDAVITMWSTAYLDAAMRNMPLMLISQLPSEEVMDVRVQRISEAYEQLQKTGCVVDYKDVLNGKLEFNYVNEEYLKNEAENAGKPAAPHIADILENIYKNWIVFNLRPYDVFQMNGTEFKENIQKIKTADASSAEYRQRRSFLNWFNGRMQDLAFLNRSMAKPFDYKPLMKYWSFFPSANFNKSKRKSLELKVKLDTEKIKMGYFNSKEIETETDGIRLDYYFDRLFVRKNYRKIKSFNNPNVLPETRAYYTAMILLQEGRYKEAAKYYAEYYHISSELNVKPVPKDRKVDLSQVPNGAEIEKFFKALFDMKEYEIIKAMCDARRFNAAMRRDYRKKVMRAELLDMPKIDYEQN